MKSSLEIAYVEDIKKVIFFLYTVKGWFHVK